MVFSKVWSTRATLNTFRSFCVLSSSSALSGYFQLMIKTTFLLSKTFEAMVVLQNLDQLMLLYFYA